MILLDGASDAALWQVGKVLRDSFGYSLRRLGVEPALGDPFWVRIVDSHPRTCWVRSHLTEGVRRRLWGLGPGVSQRQNRLTEMALLALGATVIVVESESGVSDLPHPWQRFEPAAVRREYAPARLWATEGGESRLAHTHANLNALIEGDTPRQHLVDLVQITRSFQENYATKLPPPSLGIGSPAPKIVIVGEAPAPSPCPLESTGDHPDAPFSRGPAADVLWAALDAIEFPWWESYVTNASAYGKHTPWQFGAIVGHLSLHRGAQCSSWTRKIVCLGRRAESMVRGQFGVEYWRRLVDEGVVATFAHPSHMRQFYRRELGRQRDELALFLQGICGVDALERAPEGGE